MQVHAASRATVANLDAESPLGHVDSGVEDFFDRPTVSRQTSMPNVNKDDVANQNDINTQKNQEDIEYVGSQTKPIFL